MEYHRRPTIFYNGDPKLFIKVSVDKIGVSNEHLESPIKSMGRSPMNIWGSPLRSLGFFDKNIGFQWKTLGLRGKSWGLWWTALVLQWKSGVSKAELVVFIYSPFENLQFKIWQIFLITGRFPNFLVKFIFWQFSEI